MSEEYPRRPHGQIIYEDAQGRRTNLTGNPDALTDAEMIAQALQMWANWIETGDVNLSARDAQSMGKKHRVLGEEGMERVLRLRKLAVDTGEKTHYAQVAEAIRNLPMTYYPALLNVFVEAAYAKKVFRPGQIHLWAKKAEDLCELNTRTTQEPPKLEASSPTSQTITRPKSSSRENPHPNG